MQVWRSIAEATAGGGRPRHVVTIGNFDGVHQGHRHVLARAREVAAALDPPATVVAVTFDPHPLQVLAPDRVPVQLTDLETRLALLEDNGADVVLVLAFDREMAAWSPQEFVDRVLVDGLGAVAVVVGDNFRFGSRASGDVAFLAERGAAQGFAVEGLPLDGETTPYSSTYVRGLVASGDVAAAAHVLGRLHTVDGVVVRGDQRGREMGYPTANVPTSVLAAAPADGIYAGWLRVLPDGEPMAAAVSVGTNPTFDGVERRVESYVLDRDDLELYGAHVEVSFVARIRGQVKFTGMDDLLVQMHHDVDEVRTILGAG